MQSVAVNLQSIPPKDQLEKDTEKEDEDISSVATIELPQEGSTTEATRMDVEPAEEAPTVDRIVLGPAIDVTLPISTDDKTTAAARPLAVRPETVHGKERTLGAWEDATIQTGTEAETQLGLQDAPGTPTSISSAAVGDQYAMPRTPIAIPAQIAIVSASPSKRVAFSPNKQESRLSTPNSAPVSKLKSILKPAPLRLEGIDQAHDGDEGGESSGRRVSSGTTYGITAGGNPEVEQFVTIAITALASEDFQVRAKTYKTLQAKFRASDDKLHLTEVRETIKVFAAYLLRDLDPSNPPSLVQAALKCTGYYFFNQNIVTMFTVKETESLLILILNLVNNTTEKPTCNLAVWSIASARIPPHILVPFIPQLIRAFSDNLNSRFDSLSITNECLLGLFSLFAQFPAEIVPHVQSWLLPVILRMTHPIPGIRSKSLELLTMAIPKLIEKEDPKRMQVIGEFMKDHCSNFFGLLTQNFLDTGDEVYAITVWGAMVTLIGRVLQKSSALNPMLKMAEKCFNTSSSRRTEIKMAAFQAWTRLIYNFAIGGHIASEKPLRLMLTPIKNCFLTERHKRVRLACANTWIALIYALGPKLRKNAEYILFSQLKLAIVDGSEHIRDLSLRLLIALFSNTGGQDLVEGRQNIVPGTITFADLGMAESVWVRTELLDQGLDCIYQVIGYQHKIEEDNREEWRSSGLTGLPIMTQRCAKTWESIVKAVRDLNVQEKGMRATPEANQAVSSLLFFIGRVSHCDPKTLVPNEWPDSDRKDISLLRRDPNMTGYIVRADIVHYLYVCMIEIFSVKSLVSSRYAVRDQMHADLQDALNPTLEPVSQTSEEARQQFDSARVVALTPIQFILKYWLATGESVIGTAFETSFWQAIATLVDMSRSGIRILEPLYKCLSHMDDIKIKRQTVSSRIWPSESNGPLAPLLFREFQCKYWSIIAQRLGTTINDLNEMSEDGTTEDQRGYRELLDLMAYPFSIIYEPRESKQTLPGKDHSQRVMESQDVESMEMKKRFMDKFKSICMPTWTDLLRIFYKVAQHKRGNANTAMNALARRIQDYNDVKLPFAWTQSLSVACASAIVDTLVVVMDPKISPQNPQAPVHLLGHTSHRPHSKQNLDDLLNLCSYLFEEAYNNVEKTKDLCTTTDIPPIQEAAFLLMEKTINKAPSSYVIEWLHCLQHSIIHWMDDPLGAIRNLAKTHRRAYQARVENLWNRCVLPKLASCSHESINGGPTIFGSVLAPHVATIRGAVQQAQSAATSGEAPSSPNSSPVMANPFLVKSVEPYNSKTLTLLAPLLFVGLNSHRKTIVNKTLEFWNKTFGMATTDLEYPDDIVSIMRQLKLVATISLPGWSFDDNSQTEVPQFASLSQEMLSVPSELNMKSGLSRLLKEKALLAAQRFPRKKHKRVFQLAVGSSNESPSAFDPTTVATGGSNSNSGSNSANSSRANSPSPMSTPTSSRIHTPAIDSDSSVQSSGASKKSRKKKKSKVVHSLAIDPVTKMIVAQTKETSETNTPEDSLDESEISTPTKKPRKVVVKKEPLPAPPIWLLRTPLKSYDLAEDVSSPIEPAADEMAYTGVKSGRVATDSVVGSQESPSSSVARTSIGTAYQPIAEIHATDSQGDFNMETVIQPTPTEEVAATQSGPVPNQEPIEKPTSSLDGLQRAAYVPPGSRIDTLSEGVYFTAGSEELNSGSESGSGNEAGRPSRMSSPPKQIEDMSASSAHWGLGDTSEASAVAPPTASSVAEAIETGEDFAKTVERLVEARSVVGQMDMRQLFELQNQLMTLNQAVHGVWGQLVKDSLHSRKSDK
ncbi:DNA-binding protein rif1 [Dissophora ornata]|nr:DNA-binding protein rif1 [Dissophora ornata]